jgi:hypothetical protein
MGREPNFLKQNGQENRAQVQLKKLFSLKRRYSILENFAINPIVLCWKNHLMLPDDED